MPIRVSFLQGRSLAKMNTSILERSKVQLTEIVTRNRLLNAHVSVSVKTLTPEEAIGVPGRRDFPIILGQERVVEAEVLGAKAHAFTDSPGEFVGDINEVLNLPLTSNRKRSIYVATLNATLKYLDLLENTLHCKDEDPERCGKEVASQLLKRSGRVKVGFIGLNPAIAENLIETFGVENVRITDLNKQNIHSLKYGVKVWDGNEMTEKLVKQSDVILITGTTLVNGTYDDIMLYVKNLGRKHLLYGVTGAGICKLMGLDRVCPYSRNQ
jgi:uncharacterized protein (DUF4213/DUF364 family)